MDDRKKVIAGLECCSHSKLTDRCNECPYFSSCGTEGGSFAEIAHDALALLKKQEPRVIGRWKQHKGDFVTPGGTPYYVCGACDGSGHLHGCEYPRRKVICDTCGRINIYPWERAYEDGSSLWEEDEEVVKWRQDHGFLDGMDQT